MIQQISGRIWIFNNHELKDKFGFAQTKLPDSMTPSLKIIPNLPNFIFITLYNKQTFIYVLKAHVIAGK